MKSIIATALVGAAVVAAPAVADDPRKDITVVQMPKSDGDGSTVKRPHFYEVVQAQGQFFALAGGQRDAQCSAGRDNCVIRYDWTEGVWTANDIGPLPLETGYEPKSIATDGTNLVVATGDRNGIDRLYYSDSNGATWIPSTIIKRDGQPLTNPNGLYTNRLVYSGDGFIVYGAKADFEDPAPPIISTDGGATFGPATNINLGASMGVADVAPDTGSGIAWTTRPDAGGSGHSFVMTDGFDRIRWMKDISAVSRVANLGPATYVVAMNNTKSWYRAGVGQDLVAGPTGGSSVTDLIAAPEVRDYGVFELSGNGFIYVRDATHRWASLYAGSGVKYGVPYGNLVLMVGNDGAWSYLYNKNKLPEAGFDPPEYDPLNDPPLVPPPDVPAVIDEDHSVIMPELGATPKDEDGKPVTAPATATSPATRWDPEADGYCEWRGNKVACVSQMNPLPEATGLYTLKANLSGTSVSQRGACRWTETKPQCRVWLTKKGKWRLTWSGENAGKTVTGARTVIVK